MLVRLVCINGQDIKVGFELASQFGKRLSNPYVV